MQVHKSFLLQLRIGLLKFLINLNERLIFEKKLSRFYKSNSPCNIVFDIGANQGQTIDFFLRINKDCIIYAFEPNRKLFKKLVDKYKNNPNVKLFMLGVSDQIGTKVFYENIFDFTSTFEEVNENSVFLEKKGKVLGLKSNELIKDSYEVEVTTLSHFISSNNISKIDILKIDTEGHEFSCLKGLFTENCEVEIELIQTEKLNGDMYNVDFSSIVSLLSKNKFELFSEIKHGFGNFDDVIFKKTK
jgi:FkbM family methyltransferase